MDLIDTIFKLSQAGSAVLLLFALIGAIRGLWVPGWAYRDAEKRADAWRELYEREKTAREADRERERERMPRS